MNPTVFTLKTIKWATRVSLVLLVTAILSLGPLGFQGAAAITIQQEEELSRDILKEIKQHMRLIQDPMIVDYINDLGRKILTRLPDQPFRYQFYLIDSPVYNAFATPAGHIFFHSGLLIALEEESELAGILAHEIAHVTCRHISSKIEQSQKVQLGSLAGLAAGLLLGAATGSGEVAQATALGALAGGQSAMLAFSREDEIQADQLGLDYLHKSGYSGEGLLQALVKIRSKQWYGSDQIPTYLRTHPASEDRIAYLGSRIDAGEPGIHRTENTPRPTAFDWVRARTLALYGDRDLARNTFQRALAADADDPLANYGLGLSLAQADQWTAAQSHLQKALARNAFNPYMLTDLGRVYFHTGEYGQARQSLEGALALAPGNEMARLYLGRTLLEQDEPRQAAAVLEPSASKTAQDPMIYFFLGSAYDRLGRKAEACYFLGNFYFANRKWAQARKQFERALAAGLEGERLAEVKARLEQTAQSEASQERSS